MQGWARAMAATLPLLALAAGCQRSEPAASPGPAGPLVERLIPAIQGPRFWLMGDEQKPAVLLAPGERRSIPVAAPGGSRLRFSLATLKGAPPRGTLRVEVRADGRSVQTIQIPSRRDAAWRSYSVPLGGLPPGRLEISTERFDAQGRRVPAQAEPTPPRWIALGAPRLTAPVAPSQRKVLIWISVDTLRADHLGLYGYERATSASLDRFGKTAVVFENATSTASWTLPSLASQFTARYPSQHGAVLQRIRRDPRHTTVFEALAGNGFTVLGVSANHFVSPKFEMAAGFDTLWSTEGNAGEVTRLALRALDQWDGGHLALFVHYMDPHAYYEPPAPFDSLFTRGYRGSLNGRNFESVKRDVDPAGLRYVQSLYDGEIAFADQKIGELLEALAARGLLQRAVVALSADHGEEFLEHGGWTHSRTVYQEMLHVPFALRVPGVRPARVESLVSLVDLAPTLLHALGVPAPASFNGRSLMPLLRGGRLAEASLISETERSLDGVHRLALRRGRFKYILTTSRDRSLRPPALKEELFDLESDPRELHRIESAPDLERLRRETMAYLVKARSEAGQMVPANLNKDELERLRALGYIQ